MTGCVFSLEEFSIYDGPGIRTTVFLKGCPLRCSWCHNPEGQKRDIEIIKSPNGCIGCGNCIKTNFKKESIKLCPQNLIRECGEEIESNALCDKLLKNQNILSMGGGVTFSGGEPFMQSEFLFECLKKLKGKLHTAIQTSGYCDEKTFLKALSLADYFLYDLKILDNNLHKKYTGVSNEKIINNFLTLSKSKVDFVVRVPLIPGVTDTKENITKISKLLNDNNIKYAELMSYNKMAGGKYKMLQREYTPDFDDTKDIFIHSDIFEKYDIKTVIL